jgi:peptidoglycan/LPS O-acetylase OafA/YrhL
MHLRDVRSLCRSRRSSRYLPQVRVLRPACPGPDYEWTLAPPAAHACCMTAAETGAPQSDPRPPRHSGRPLGALALLVAAVVMSVFGDPVPSVAAAVVVVVLAPMVQPADVDYAPLNRLLARVAEVVRRGG